MKTLRIDLADRSYDILIGRSLLASVGDFIPPTARVQRAVIISNPIVNGLYGSRVQSGLTQSGIEAEMFEVPDGEAHKSFQQAQSLYDRLIEGRYDRSTLVIALGGGVIGDLTGFVAATYQRGVPFLQVPTTL